MRKIEKKQATRKQNNGKGRMGEPSGRRCGEGAGGRLKRKERAVAGKVEEGGVGSKGWM